MIQLLGKNEKENIRPLYEQCFAKEDGKEFMDFYFHTRLPHNDVVVSREEEKIVSALHLIPKTVVSGAQKAEVKYIYGVGTLKKYRKRGHMNQLFAFTLEEMYQNLEPFTYLIPSDEKNAEIYRKLGFSYVTNKQAQKPEHQRKKAANSLLVRKADASDMIRLSIFAQKEMERRNVISLAKTIDYFKEMMDLIHVEGGRIEIYVENKVIVGYRIWVGKEILEEVLSPEIQYLTQQSESTKPYVMARIVHLEKMLSMLKIEEDAEITVRISDPVIQENNGCFRICYKNQGITVKKIKEDKIQIQADFQMSIGELTSHLFDYRQMADFPMNLKQRQLFIHDFV